MANTQCNTSSGLVCVKNFGITGYTMTDFERFKATTDGSVEIEIAERSRAFFGRVLSKHGIQPEWPWVESSTKSTGVDRGSKIDPDDGNIRALVVHDETLAIVYDRRTDFNMHEVTFYERNPSPELLLWRDVILEEQEAIGSD